MTKRRKSSNKVKRRLPAQAWKEGEWTPPISGVTTEFSLEGLFIETRHPFSLGSQVRIELAFSGRKIKLNGVVSQVLKAEPHKRAIQISGMDVDVAFSEEDTRKFVTDPTPKQRIQIDSAVVAYFGSESRQLQLRNLSVSGAALISESRLPDVSFVRMIFSLTDSSQPIEVQGIPVRSEETADGILIGMRFKDPPESVIAQIEDFIHQQEEKSTDEINHQSRRGENRRSGSDRRKS